MTSNDSRIFYQELAKKLRIYDVLDQSEGSQKRGLGRFSESQIMTLMDELKHEIGLTDFVVKHSDIISPTSVSLYVLNDALWKIMRRSESQQKMLAMCTIPLCTYDKKSASYPYGVKRWDIHPSSVTVTVAPKLKFEIVGQGGDFSGFIEKKMLTTRHFGIPDTSELVPNYQFSKIRIDIDLPEVRVESNPLPNEEIDYDYAESAKVFYDHGLLLSGDGESFTLAVDKRKPLKLKGDVLFYIGWRGDDEDTSIGVLVDIWFQLLKELIEKSKSEVQ